MELENENQGGVTEHQDSTFHVTDASASLFLDKSIRKLGPKLNSVNRRQARMESSLQRLEAKCDLIIHSVAQLVTKSQHEPHSIQQVQQLFQTVSSPGLSTDVHCFDSVFHQVSDYKSIKSQPFGPCLEDPFHDVPLEYKMSMRFLEKLKSQSSGPGNFAVKISERLYPELFTAENLRLKYSYFGGGVLNKQELDPQRKEILQRYVLSFYPEYQNPDLWKSQIVAKVNENLRRPVQRKRVKIPDNEW
ncbi:hypothetical protein ACJMK2_012668 [Sinanodonta woodiana]|uniref:BEN domain-containing protein n=1 Tax=Sinanodonta woodiana TaxID=1069815 RepID=A0ABD3VBZ7_SINWO